MHPHDPDRVAAVGQGAGEGAPADSRQFTMPADRPGSGRLLVLIGFVAIVGLVGQSMYRRWRWTTSGTGRIEVAVNPDDAIISLDGEPPRRSPATMIVRAGAHTLTVARGGYMRVEQRIDVDPGETVEVPVSLMAIPPLPTATRPVPVRSSSHAQRSSPPRAVRANGVSYIDMKARAVR